jgi:hypothetical protein
MVLILLHCPPYLLPQVQLVVKSQFYIMWSHWYYTRNGFWFAGLSALRLADARSVLVELQLVFKLIFGADAVATSIFALVMTT